MMTRRTIVIAAVFAAVAGLCTLIPLLNAFGFEYAFLFGILSTFTAGPLAIATIRPAYRAGEPTRPPLLRALWTNFLLLVLPFLVMIGSAFAGLVCSLPEGIGFFVLLPVVTAAFGTALGYFCTIHYRKAHLVYWLIVAATIAYALALGYFTPAIFSYNLFYGFFPGLTYDELLPLTWSLVFFRLLTLAAAALLLRLAIVLESVSSPDDPVTRKGLALVRALLRPPSLYTSGGATIAVILLYLFRCPLGFESTEGHIRHVLGGEVHTDHFTIIYSPESCDSARIHRIAEEHEFLLSRLSDMLSLGKTEPITSFIYPSNEVKQKLIGAGNTSIAKPWTHQVHVSLSSLDGVLGHELAHVLAGRFGQPIIHANLSTGLTEGLAMALDLSHGERTDHQYAAAMRKQGIAPDITTLMSFRGFAVQSSAVSYTLAGSFCRYLIDRYGIRRIAQVYGNSSYTSVYGRSLRDLVEEWRGFIERIQVSGEDTMVVDAYFRRPGVFGKICPRVVARQLREASQTFREKQYEPAAVRFRAIYDATGAYEALSGYLASVYALKQYDSVVALYWSRVATDPRPDRYLSLSILFGDAFWAKGDTATALAILRRTAAANASAGLTEQACIRLEALAETDPAAYFTYLTTDIPDSERVMYASKLIVTSRESPLAFYLRGRASQRAGRFEEALYSFRDVDDRQLPKPLRAARLWATGDCLFRLERYQEARGPYWESLNAMGTDARQAEVNDMISRCDWMSKRR